MKAPDTIEGTMTEAVMATIASELSHAAAGDATRIGQYNRVYSRVLECLEKCRMDAEQKMRAPRVWLNGDPERCAHGFRYGHCPWACMPHDASRMARADANRPSGR